MDWVSRQYTAKHLGRGPRKVVGVILHDTAGSGTINDVKYLANPSDGRTVSVDFVATRDGEVYQLNPDLDNNWTFHAGRATSFKGLRNAAVNKGCVGIEIAQRADLTLVPTYTTEQVASTARLCADLVKQYGLNREDITTHAKVITDGSRSDPRKFPWLQFWSAFESFGGSGSVFHTVMPGDTLWALANKYGTRIETIKGLNGMNEFSNVITVGQMLRVR